MSGLLDTVAELDRSDMTLGQWLGVTLQLEREAFGVDPPALRGDARSAWWGSMLHATHTELAEMADECGYKAWDKNRGNWVNREAFIKEAADALHFIALLLDSVHCTGEELSEAYLTQVLKNYRRQQGEGDDIQARRCGGCGRSLDDVGIVPVTFPAANSGIAQVFACKACGFHEEGSAVAR